MVLNKTEVAENLKSELERVGLTQSWAARQLDITPTYFGRCLNGKLEPSLELAFKMKDLASKLKSSGLVKAI